MSRNDTHGGSHGSKHHQTGVWTVVFMVMVCMTLTAVGVTAKAILEPETKMLIPDYAPIAEEKYAVDIPDEEPEEKLDKPEGGGSVSITYSPGVSISLKNKQVSLMYQNPTRSNSDVVIMLVIQDTVIAESERIIPGKQVRRLDLVEGAEEILQPGAYNAVLLVQPFDPESTEKALVDTECEVIVTVRK